MHTVIHRKEEGLSKPEVVGKLKNELDKRSEQYQGMSEIEALAHAYEKNFTDNFIVTDKADLKYMINQGDIVLHHESSDYFQAVKDTITDLRPAKNLNLQEGTALTGDHRFVAMEGANFTIEDGRFAPLNGVLGRRMYDCKIIKSDKPFLLSHREHGNITLQAGTYLVYSQIDSKTLTRVLD